MLEVRDAWCEMELRKHTKKRFQWKKKTLTTLTGMNQVKNSGKETITINDSSQGIDTNGYP
eukprot:1427256-Ditylum_brightwellii.AAC.2